MTTDTPATPAITTAGHRPCTGERGLDKLDHRRQARPPATSSTTGDNSTTGHKLDHRGLARDLFQRVGLDRVYAGVDPDNEKSLFALAKAPGVRQVDAELYELTSSALLDPAG